jgi:hypothetical protein
MTQNSNPFSTDSKGLDSNEAMKLAERLRKFSPPGLSQQQGKRVLIKTYLLRLLSGLEDKS